MIRQGEPTYEFIYKWARLVLVNKLYLKILKVAKKVPMKS